jgi:hypothetical protein
MASRDSRLEYERRMHRVVEYLDQHLDRPLDLGTLADVAYFFSFLFRRLSREWARR